MLCLLFFYRQKLYEIIFADLVNLLALICGFWIPDSGFWFPDSGFPIPVPDSRFLVLGCPFIAGLRFLMLLHFQGIIGKGHACKPEAR